MADFLTAFGIRLFKRLDYPLYVGLWLNLSRVRLLPAYGAFRGIKAALAKRLPHDIFDAIAASEDEAAEMQFSANVRLMEEQAAEAARRML